VDVADRAGEALLPAVAVAEPEAVDSGTAPLVRAGAGVAALALGVVP
jgi:hypothetical protein